eukprot:scaffold1517_cov397-Prasinococcus_capsulatus_cf.AAC.2
MGCEWARVGGQCGALRMGRGLLQITPICPGEREGMGLSGLSAERAIRRASLICRKEERQGVRGDDG